MCKWRYFIPEKSLGDFRFFEAQGRENEKKRLKRPIIREYHRHRGPQRTERRRKSMKSNTKRKQQKQQKVSKKREFLRKIIESSIFWKKSQTHKMVDFWKKKKLHKRTFPACIFFSLQPGNKGNNFFSTEKSLVSFDEMRVHGATFASLRERFVCCEAYVS